MRPLIAAAILCVGSVEILIGQERMPRGYLYRGPLYASRPAIVVTPEGGMPLEFSGSSFASGTLTTTVRSLTLRPIPLSAITIRAAYGPTPEGMVAFRMRLPRPPVEAESSARIGPEQTFPNLPFRIARQDPYVLFRTPLPPMKIVFTLERIDGQDGFLIFDNPDATELLWEALGRPTLTQQ